MAYNKAKAEQEWLRWKEAEEEQLRELGMDEEKIRLLHTYDWEEFNRDRQYWQRWVDWGSRSESSFDLDAALPIKDIASLLDNIENEALLQVLSGESKVTIQILLLRIRGYNGYEIAEKLGLTQKAVNLRLVRLRKKLKKFFEP